MLSPSERSEWRKAHANEERAAPAVRIRESPGNIIDESERTKRTTRRPQHRVPKVLATFKYKPVARKIRPQEAVLPE